MRGKKRQFSASEKLQVAKEAIKGELTIAEISSKYGVHSTQISKWKKQAQEYLQAGFANRLELSTDYYEKRLGELYQQIGQLKVENDFLKKKCDLLEE
jgi:transposase